MVAKCNTLTFSFTFSFTGASAVRIVFVSVKHASVPVRFTVKSVTCATRATFSRRAVEYADGSERILFSYAWLAARHRAAVRPRSLATASHAFCLRHRHAMNRRIGLHIHRPGVTMGQSGEALCWKLNVIFSYLYPRWEFSIPVVSCGISPA